MRAARRAQRWAFAGLAVAVVGCGSQTAQRRGAAAVATPAGTIAFVRGGPGDVMLPGEIGVSRRLGVFTVELATGRERRITPGGMLAQSPAWSSDGRAIAFSRYRERRGRSATTVLATIGADGRRPRRLVACRLPRCDGDGQPAFSPAGSKLAFRRSTRHGGKLFVADADGRSPALVSPLRGLSVYGGPSWSRDGSNLVFSAYRHGGKTIELYLVAANGRGLRRIGRYTAGAWSPVRDELAVERLDGRAIELIRPDGTVIRALTDCRRRCDDAAPAWSPGGRYVAFVRTPKGGRAAIHVVRRDGTGLRRVTRRYDYVCCPSWRPAS